MQTMVTFARLAVLDLTRQRLAFGAVGEARGRLTSQIVWNRSEVHTQTIGMWWLSYGGHSERLNHRVGKCIA